ncbi:peroxidase-related enzyme [Labrys wisconsinensis]|uniref:Peroxidase-related enzyme n=1 Tax=Labrys wisconsinensis TaxID=425677 RepID=A0ABU0JLY6_9HYPH|nr:peroxidase-related enzyme [Labrys wisconsinensis]MDQ0475294.1 putative peroxidase-related enzyme [Labrys wisconsinensis]
MPEGLVDVSGRDEISRLRPPAEAALPADVRALAEANHRENWIRALSVNPDTARRFAAYFGGLFDPKAGRLPIRERELIAVVVSSANGCGLCEIHHTLALGDALGDAAKARRIALDHHLAPLTPREHALVDFAAKVTTAPKSIGPGDFDRLRSVGLDDADILEAIETSAWFNHTNRIFISLGVVPDDKYFAG